MELENIIMKIEDNSETMKPGKYKVKDLIEFFQAVDPERFIVWSGAKSQPLIILAPQPGRCLILCESEI